MHQVGQKVGKNRFGVGIKPTGFALRNGVVENPYFGPAGTVEVRLMHDVTPFVVGQFVKGEVRAEKRGNQRVTRYLARAPVDPPARPGMLKRYN
jgi:hypothetical protein